MDKICCAQVGIDETRREALYILGLPLPPIQLVQELVHPQYVRMCPLFVVSDITFEAQNPVEQKRGFELFLVVLFSC